MKADCAWLVCCCEKDEFCLLEVCLCRSARLGVVELFLNLPLCLPVCLSFTGSSEKLELRLFCRWEVGVSTVCLPGSWLGYRLVSR